MTTAEALSCQELVELVTDYLEDALSAEARARFEEHVDHCRGCGIYLAQMRETIRLCGSLEPEHVTPEAEQALRQAFAAWHSTSS